MISAPPLCMGNSLAPGAWEPTEVVAEGVIAAQVVAGASEPAKAVFGLCGLTQAGAHPGGSWGMEKEAAGQPCPSLHMPLYCGTLLLWWAQAFLQTTWLYLYHIQPLQATSTQPTPVLLPDLSCKPQVSAPAPAHTVGCLSQAGACRLVALSI